MRKAVFLDRDGIINFEPGNYTCSVEKFIINEGIGESIKLLKENGFIVIVISNQGGIAKGLYSVSDVTEMQNKLEDYLSTFNTSLDDFYFCPHHEEISKCLCRKPESLLFEKAMAVHNIDPNLSVMIGDSDRDVLSAENAGIKGIKVLPNSNIYQICKEIINKFGNG